MEKEELFKIIGLSPIDEDFLVPNGAARMIICRYDSGKIVPVIISGGHWDLLYWTWRLSDEHLSFEELLMEMLAEKDRLW